MKRLIIADLRSTERYNKTVGHYGYLANLYIKLFSPICDVKVAGGPVYGNEFLEKNYMPLPYNSYDDEPLIKRYWRTLKNCRCLFKKANRNDIIVLQNSSLSTSLVALTLLFKKLNIYIISYDKDAISSRLKRLIFSFARRNIRGLITSNNEVGKAFGIAYCIVPDYIYTGNIKDIENSKYPEKKYDFAIMGGFYPDKGVVEAVKKLADTKYKVILAGRPYDENMEKELAHICQEARNIEYHFGFLSNDDYNRYMNESRYCLLNYQGMYLQRSSGVVLDAMFHGVPVVGHRSFPLKIAEEFGVGYVYNDISDFNPDIVLHEDVWNKYHEEVINYLKKNSESKNILMDFLNLNKDE